MGLPASFDSVAMTITIGLIDTSYSGQETCLDSSFYRPKNRWCWIPLDDPYSCRIPSWDGPHCFTVVAAASCCEDRGDVDDDDVADIQDLIYLSAYVNLGGSEPPCMAQADVDGDDNVDGDDVTHLLNYMFSSGPAPVGCGG